MSVPKSAISFEKGTSNASARALAASTLGLQNKKKPPSLSPVPKLAWFSPNQAEIGEWAVYGQSPAAALRSPRRNAPGKSLSKQRVSARNCGEKRSPSTPLDTIIVNVNGTHDDNRKTA